MAGGGVSGQPENPPGYATEQSEKIRMSPNLMPYLLVYCETRTGGDEPTVSDLTLDQVIAAGAIYEQLRILTDVLQRIKQFIIDK